MTKDEMKNRISMALKDPTLQQGFECICKENAELKGLKDVATLIRANNDTVVTLMQLNNMLVSKSQQLTKAKDIIKDLCVMVRELNNPNVQLTNVDYSLLEAEQFIKDSEVEK